MSQYDYNAPVRYEPPPPRERRPFPRWILIAIGVIVGLVLIGCLALNAFVGRMRSVMDAALPPAAVHVGQPKQWRVLDETGGGILSRIGGGIGPLICADFENDGDEEILLIGMTGGSKLFEVDGAVADVKLAGEEYLYGCVAWDYDRDGIAEIVVPENNSDKLLAMDLTGKLLGKIKGSSLMMNVKTGDFTGDGQLELVALDPSASGRQQRYLVFGKKGKKLDSIIAGNILAPVVGDLDNDGLDELVFTHPFSSSIEISGISQTKTTKSGWPEYDRDSKTNYEALACADLNTDGFSEIIAGRCGYYDASSSTFRHFTLPAAFDKEKPGIMESVAVGDFASDPGLEVAVTCMMGSSILVFNLDGNCAYYEELGEHAWATACVSSGGQDYLVVQLIDRLLIYP